jgi:hypothetical protein
LNLRPPGANRSDPGVPSALRRCRAISVALSRLRCAHFGPRIAPRRQPMARHRAPSPRSRAPRGLSLLQRRASGALQVAGWTLASPPKRARSGVRGDACCLPKQQQSFGRRRLAAAAPIRPIRQRGGRRRGRPQTAPFVAKQRSRPALPLVVRSEHATPELGDIRSARKSSRAEGARAAAAEPELHGTERRLATAACRPEEQRRWSAGKRCSSPPCRPRRSCSSLSRSRRSGP